MVYRSYRELAAHECRGRDYAIEARPGHTGFLVMAPHGGCIEPGTDILAAALAARGHAYYGFIGLKSSDNRSLHLTSHTFDEPLAGYMASRAEWILTLHGCARRDASILVGGRDGIRRTLFHNGLVAAGFRARISREKGLTGRHPENLCNRGRLGVGVQLEIARDLRDQLLRPTGSDPLLQRLTTTLAPILEAIPPAAQRRKPFAEGGIDATHFCCQVCGHIAVDAIAGDCPICRAVPEGFKEAAI